MAKIEIKKPIVEEISEYLKDAQSAVVVDYRGLTVEQDTQLRKKLREAGVVYKVYKNTMINFAIKGTEFESLAPYLEGPTAVVFSYDEDNQNPNAVEAHVKGADSKRDLAVIGISKDKLNDDVLSQISVAAVGNSADLSLGEQVVAIGNALGYGQSVTTGIVSALNRQIGTDESGKSDGNTYIQTDAAINPGNSGGALFNMKGELVGINTAKIASAQIEGMGYAIPISDVHDLIEDLKNQTTRTEVVDEKDRGYLGISGTDVTSDVSSTYHIPEGVFLAEVTDGSPAANAGLSRGYVITKFDGKTINSSSELQNLVKYYKSGETVTITAQVPENSQYNEKEFHVTLGTNENQNA